MLTDDYCIISREANAISKALSDMWEYLGRPKSPLTKSGGKLMEVLISSWQDLFPVQSKKWIEMRANYKKAELSISQQVKRHTGRALASYPNYIYLMMKKLFPEFDATERKNCMKMVKKWKIFQMANKV